MTARHDWDALAALRGLRWRNLRRLHAMARRGSGLRRLLAGRQSLAALAEIDA